MTLGQSRGGHEQRGHPAARQTAEPLPPPRQPVRGGLHGLALDELIEARVEGDRICFAGLSLPLPAARDLRAYEGQAIVIGIRPSAFFDAALSRDESRPTIEVKVDVVEELGSEKN